MNKKERVIAALKGDYIDKRPVSLLLSLYGAKLTSCPLAEYYTNHEYFINGQIAAMEKLDSDILFSPFSLSSYAQSFGCEIIIPEKGAPNVSKTVAGNADEFKKLIIPDIDSNSSLTYIRECIRGLSKHYDAKIPIAGIMLAPTDLPALIMGIENWFETILFDTDNAKNIMIRLTEHFISMANAMITDGADVIAVPSVFSNPVFITEKIAKELIIPILSTAFQEVNAPIFIHSVSNKMDKFAGLYTKLPNVAGVIIDSNDDFNNIRNDIDEHKVIIGNLDGPNLVNQSIETIRENCLSILNDRKNDRHFILGTSRADINYDTHIENLLCITETVKEYYS
ncbi:MAG: hypothetical protein GY756_24690 [bacterium]|nr:hypothetical protein [bacterium]